MNNKKKQRAVVAMATVLSVTSIASPLPVMAQEYNPVPPAIIQEESKQQETAPDIGLPKKLQATAGMTLQEITLPEDWTWVDDSTLITAETAEYPARFSVDDVTYDYSNVEGYNAEGHYVERMIAVIVEPAKQEPAELAQKKSYMLKGNTPTTFNAGDIAINATNFPDETFRNYVKESFDTDTSGSLSATEIAGITGINVNDNTNIKDLTGIEHFTALTVLYCANTGISDLDVSKNTLLNILLCSDTRLERLDVSNNTNLTFLNCAGNPIPYLNTGTNNNITDLFAGGNIELVLEMEEDSFDIADKFAGIDTTKVMNVRNANYDSSTGIMSNYRIGKGQTIDYTYNCGTSTAGTTQTMNVAVRIVGKSSITITDNLNKPYDGNAVSDKPTVSKTKDTWNRVSYMWEKKVNATDWEEIASAPADAGTYRVTATLAPQMDFYTGATSAPVEFTISQATNSWTDRLSITDWTYGETANEPKATAKFGSVKSYLYSGSEKGTYTDTVPANAGIWYVKAVVEGTDNYEGLESEPFKFEIKKAKAPAISLPANLSGVYDTKLSTIALHDGWSWVNGEETLTASNTGYKARLTVDDSNYDYTGTEGYDSTNHYVERTLTVTVSEAKNTWTQEPVIADWTYGETASVPMADAKYGDVTFSYSDSENGTYTDTVPANAGTWYMKAVVNATADYTGLNKVVPFVIAPKDVTGDSQIIVPDITADTKLDELVIKDGDKVLVQDTDYDVSKAQDGKNVTVTITFKGNYTGTIIKTYTVKENVASGGNSNKSDGKNTEDKKAVQTGDTTAVGLWSTILAFSAGLAVFLKRKKHKEQTEE